MKKQIVVLLLAILGLSTNLLAQTEKNGDGNLPDPGITGMYCVAPTPITATCVATADPLHPSLGITYTYTVDVTPDPVNPSGYIDWFVTTDPTIIEDGVITTSIETAAGTYILASGSTYHSVTNVSESVDISWESVPAAGTNLFLVTYVKKNDGCTDNIKVYKIVPQHIFTLDLAYLNAVDPTVVGSNTDCVAPVFDATFDPSILPAGEMVYDYGVNYVYFVVNAANWGHSWKPSFEFVLTGTPNGLTTSSATAIHWATPAGSVSGTWNPTTLHATIPNVYESAANVTPSTGTTVGTTGECIVVRVTFDYGANITTRDIPFTLAVNGIMYDGTGYTNPNYADIHHQAQPAPGNACPWFDDYINDKLAYTLTLRPTIVDNTPDTPNPTNFILDNSEQP